MRKLAEIALLILLALPLAGCPGREKLKAVPTTNQACEAMFKIFYRNGRFRLTGSEYDGLLEENQIKITDFKSWFKEECPLQYARTAGGKKK